MQPEHPELRLTYAAIGVRLGISAEAARTLTRRRGWQRIAPNRKGAPVIVVLTAEDLEGEQWRTEEERSPPSNGADIPEHEADSAGQRVEQAERRADEANARADVALALADRLSAQLADAVTRGDRASDRADRLERDLTAALAVADLARAAAREAQDRADVLQRAEEARKARGRWARLRAAWRGQ
jgi:hypothetical protein